MVTSDTASRPVVRTSWGFVANAAVAACLGIVLSRIISGLGIAIGGAIADRDPVLTNSSVEMASGPDSVYLGGLAASIIAAALLVLIYPGAKDRSWGKLSLMWVILFTFQEAFMGMIRIGLSPDSEAAAGFASLSPPDGLEVVVAAGGGVGILLLGLAASPAVLSFARHRSELATPPERVRFVGMIGLMPAVIGSLLAVPFFLNDPVVMSSLPLIGLFMIIAVVAAPWSRPTRTPELGEEVGISVGFVVGVAASLVLLYLALAPGVPIPPLGENLEWRFRP